MWVLFQDATCRCQGFSTTIRCCFRLRVVFSRMTNLWLPRISGPFRESLYRNGWLWSVGIKTMESLCATTRVFLFRASLRRSFLYSPYSRFPTRIPSIPRWPILPCFASMIVLERYTKTIRLFHSMDSRRIRFSGSCRILSSGNRRPCRRQNPQGSLFLWRVTFAPKSSCLKWCRLCRRLTVFVSFTWT